MSLEHSNWARVVSFLPKHCGNEGKKWHNEQAQNEPTGKIKEFPAPLAVP
jgi:hypothetical protein